MRTYARTANRSDAGRIAGSSRARRRKPGGAGDAEQHRGAAGTIGRAGKTISSDRGEARLLAYVGTGERVQLVGEIQQLRSILQSFSEKQLQPGNSSAISSFQPEHESQCRVGTDQSDGLESLPGQQTKPGERGRAANDAARA